MGINRNGKKREEGGEEGGEEDGGEGGEEGGEDRSKWRQGRESKRMIRVELEGVSGGTRGVREVLGVSGKY
ncbi:hypothetical protein Pmani_005456 [Petrolisthes manimaculis]|uniref:Uncharacterized protein n=1 Tax=Petrolisthes manimaculis TaxID=1843537 RepID=A0AAE1QBN6_9EUCA|nr:hypothetical protein Pmani_005456 [Petrolisthes manimaculis]